MKTLTIVVLVLGTSLLAPRATLGDGGTIGPPAGRAVVRTVPGAADLAAPLGAAASPAAIGTHVGGRTVRVDCARGESIAKALRSSIDPLVVEISGVCQESVLVERRGVTLRGGSAATDGIARPATPGSDIPLRVRARGTTIENLTISGGAVAVERGGEHDSRDRQTTISGCVIADAPRWGLVVSGEYVVLSDVAIRRCGAGGIVAQSGAWVNCVTGCSVSAGPSAEQAPGVLAQVNSLVALHESDVAGQGALSAWGFSYVFASGSTLSGSIGANFHAGVFVTSGSTLESDGAWNGVVNRSIMSVEGSTFTGHFAADEASTLVFLDATQVGGASGRNEITAVADSTVRAGNSTLLGPLRVDGFSRLLLQGATIVQDKIRCSAAADAWAEDPSLIVGNVAGCQHLVKP